MNYVLNHGEPLLTRGEVRAQTQAQSQRRDSMSRRTIIGSGVSIADMTRCNGCACKVRLGHRKVVVSLRTLEQRQVRLCPSCVRKLSRHQALTSVFYFKESRLGRPMFRAVSVEMAESMLSDMDTRDRQEYLVMAEIERQVEKLSWEAHQEVLTAIRETQPERHAQWRRAIAKLEANPKAQRKGSKSAPAVEVEDPTPAFDPSDNLSFEQKLAAINTKLNLNEEV